MIAQVASLCGTAPAQVCVSWDVQRGIPVLPKTVTQARMIQNNTLTRLPEEMFEQVNKMYLEPGEVHFMNVAATIEFDMFEKTADEPV